MSKPIAPVHLGYAVGSGDPVAIPVGHMCVTGQTQQAGKTTTLEALIIRSALRAVTFITKRGETSFRTGHTIAPYFRERADWQFVASLIDATMGEKNKLLRSFLMKVCRGTTTLAEVYANVLVAKAGSRGFSESIYTEIEGYLDLVVPQIAELPPSRRLALGDGLNVIDLSPYRAELQGLVIRSVIEHVYERESGIVTVIPEAWEFLPEQRGSPVKLAFETLVRKGAALRNFVWLDSQDLAGVWKLAVRACPVILVGVQREANEIKRTLQNIPASVTKPTAADVATLGLGEFVACWSKHAIKTYVQPAWMANTIARQVARGEIDARNAATLAGAGVMRRAVAQAFNVPARQLATTKETNVTKAEAAALERELAALKHENDELRRRLAALEKQKGTDGTQGAVHDGRTVGARGADPARKSGPQRTDDHAAAVARDRAAAPIGALDRDVHASPSLAHADDVEALYQTIKARLIADAPAIVLQLHQTRPELEVTVERRTVVIDSVSLKGRVARLIADGFFDEPKAQKATRGELKRTGRDINTGSLSRTLGELVADGFLNRAAGATYVLAPGARVRVVEP
jgi:hypothetical protein